MADSVLVTMGEGVASDTTVVELADPLLDAVVAGAAEVDVELCGDYDSDSRNNEKRTRDSARISGKKYDFEMLTIETYWAGITIMLLVIELMDPAGSSILCGPGDVMDEEATVIDVFTGRPALLTAVRIVLPVCC